jgi:hypothetical protein
MRDDEFWLPIEIGFEAYVQALQTASHQYLDILGIPEVISTGKS